MDFGLLNLLNGSCARSTGGMITDDGGVAERRGQDWIIMDKPIGLLRLNWLNQLTFNNDGL